MQEEIFLQTEVLEKKLCTVVLYSGNIAGEVLF